MLEPPKALEMSVSLVFFYLSCMAYNSTCPTMYLLICSKLNLYKSVSLSTLSLLCVWVSLCSVESVYDPILVLSHSPKIEV